MAQLFGELVSVARRSCCRVGVPSGGNDKVAATKFCVPGFDMKETIRFFYTGNSTAVTEGDTIFYTFPEQDLQDIRGIIGLRKYFAVFIGDGFKAPFFQETDEVKVCEMAEGGLQEFKIIAVMFQKIIDVALMRYVAASRS